MKRLIDADALIKYFRNEVHANKAAEVVDRWAKDNLVEAAIVGKPLPSGTILQQYNREDGSPWMRLIKREGAKI